MWPWARWRKSNRSLKTNSPSKLYESDHLQRAAGDCLRPGGVELTRRGLSFCNIPKNARVLDIGCGRGVAVDYCRNRLGLNAMGLDISEKLLKEEESVFPDSPKVLGDGHHLPFADESFNAVLMECSLSLMEDPIKTIAESRRALKKKGYLIISDIYLRKRVPGIHLPSVHCCFNGAVSQDDMERRLADAGFDVLLFEDHSHELKMLSVRLVLEYGSLKRFWEAFLGQDFSEHFCNDLFLARPGYALILAQKRNHPWTTRPFV